MGYDTNRFQKPVDPNLICGICNGVLEVPVLTPCGHSFCTQCLTTWLSRPGANTCPECRAWVESDSVKPILSLRNLIQAMDVSCVNAARGCKVVTSLEKHPAHLRSCQFVLVTCVGCQMEVNSSELADHQMECAAIKKVLEADEEISRSKCSLGSPNKRLSPTRNPRLTSQHGGRNPSCSLSRITSHLQSSGQVTRLLSRINSLEKQVGRLLDDLHESHSKNSHLYSQYRKIKDELEDQRRLDDLHAMRLNDMTYYHNFDLNDYRISTQQDIAKLSLLIARHLLQKPKYIDSNRVFLAVRRCYEAYFPGSPGKRNNHDVHMLLATAYASNWFSTSQRITLGCWLQCVLQCQGCKRLIEG